MVLSSVLSLLGGVALFLFGMSIMGDGLKKVAGSSMETILYRLAGTPVKGLLLGTAVTAVIQSSAATSVMVVGFVNSGIMTLQQAIGVIHGALIGTSVTGWIICLSYIESAGGWVSLLSTSTITAVVAIVGIGLRMFSKKRSRQHVGDILLGFAVLMFGMQAMSSAVSALKENAVFLSLLTAFSRPLVGILVGAVFAAILQSASAAVGIVQALSVTGAITFASAFPLILGIAMGAGVPVLLSAIGAKAAARKAAVSYTVIEIAGAAACAAVYYIYEALSGQSGAAFAARVMTPVSVAMVNSLFRIATAVLVMPFNGTLERLCGRFVRISASEQAAGASFDRLDDRFLASPPVAIDQSRLTLLDMAKTAQVNFEDALNIIKHYDADLARKIEDEENLVDEYEDKIGTYLVKLNAGELSAAQNEEVAKYLRTLSDFERISDHAMNLSELAGEIEEKKVAFTGEAEREMDTLASAVREIVQLAFQAFIRGDLETAYRVEPLEECIDNLCDDMKLHHVDRVQEGRCTLSQGFVFMDYITNCERVADHCSNLAVAAIETGKELFDPHDYINRLKEKHMNHFSEYFEEYSRKYAI